MKWIRFVILLIGAMILQASFTHTLALDEGHVRPNLLLVLLVYVAFYTETDELISACFITGLATDLISSTMGPHTLAFGAIGTLLGEIRRYIVVDKWLHQGIAILSAGLLSGILINFLLRLKGHPGAYISVWWMPLYSAVLGPLLFFPLHWLMRPNRSRRRLSTL